MHHIIIKQQTRIQCLDPPKILYFFIMTIFYAPAREKQYQITFILTKLVQMGIFSLHSQCPNFSQENHFHKQK